MRGIVFSHFNSKTSSLIPCPVGRDDIDPLRTRETDTFLPCSFGIVCFNSCQNALGAYRMTIRWHKLDGITTDNILNQRGRIRCSSTNEPQFDP